MNKKFAPRGSNPVRRDRERKWRVPEMIKIANSNIGVFNEQDLGTISVIRRQLPQNYNTNQYEELRRLLKKYNLINASLYYSD